MSKAGDRWVPLEKLTSELGPKFGQNTNATLLDERVAQIVERINTSITSQDFFNAICLISELFEKLSQDEIEALNLKTNAYVLVLNATLRNPVFISTIRAISSERKSVPDLMNNPEHKARLTLVNTAITLAFLGISLNHERIGEKSVSFLRSNIEEIVKNIAESRQPDSESFVSTCLLLERIVWDYNFHLSETRDSKFPIRLDTNFLFSGLKVSRSIAGITLVSLVIRPRIESRFKKSMKIFTSGRFYLATELHNFYLTAFELDEKIGHYYRKAPSDLKKYFSMFIKSNERNLIYCIKLVCSNFEIPQGEDQRSVVLRKVRESSKIREGLAKFTENNFRAFLTKSSKESNEWTNKIFLISIKTFSVLSLLDRARDTNWSVGAATFELSQWVKEVHSVLNKYYIEDDWEVLKRYLTQEGVSVEWKSSFYIPTQDDYDENKEAERRKKVFSSLIKAILAMINTEGGVIIVGLIENADRVVRNEVTENTLSKNNVVFYDINKELEILGKSLDTVRLEMLDKLSQVTDTTPEKFNKLVSLETFRLKNDDSGATIVKITVKKSHFFYNVEIKNDTRWVSLTKRAQARNVEVDLRQYIEPKNDPTLS